MYFSLPISGAQSIHYHPAKTELKTLNQLKIYSTYNLIIFQCRCHTYETFKLYYSIDDIKRSSIVNNTLSIGMVRNLYFNHYYNFQIKYWENQFEIDHNPDIIFKMRVWTKSNLEKVLIEPTWLSIMIRWKPVK